MPIQGMLTYPGDCMTYNYPQRFNITQNPSFKTCEFIQMLHLTAVQGELWA